MSSEIVDLEEERLKKMLAEIYTAQMEHFFSDDMMGDLIQKLGIDEEEAISLISCLLSRGWIKCLGIKEKFFLRPGFISGMPVVLTTTGLAVVKD